MKAEVLNHKLDIAAAAKTHGLDPALVAAVVECESAGQPGAMRFEPLYRYTDPRAPKPAISSRDTDIVAQKISWGLMQVMGGTARTELGYTGWLPDLCAPAIGLDLGCRYLARLITRHGEDGGVSSYNQGSPRKNPHGRYLNQPYVDKVLAAKATYAAAFALTPDPSPVERARGDEAIPATTTPDKPLTKKGKGK
jgi:soluble lytic murein transglycosylase-like protein